MVTNGGQVRIWNELMMVYPTIYLDRLNKSKTSVKVITHPRFKLENLYKRTGGESSCSRQ
jgi:hypothetical protein